MSRPNRLSQRISRLRPSGTAAVFEAVAALRQRGEQVLSLSVGEPDYAPPAHVLSAVQRALAEPDALRYTQVAGTRSLREAICADSHRRRGVAHGPEQVVVGAGAKHVLFNLAQALFDPGDRVVIPVPCWGSYVEQARLAGAEPVLLPTEPRDGFLPTPAALAQALASGEAAARAVVLCVPSNPTGAVADADAWSALARVLRDHEAFVIVDEIYGQLTYDGFVQPSLLSVAPDLAERLVVVDGVSKTYAMTGFRVGWMLGPQDVATAVAALQGQATTNVTTLAQRAAEAALVGDQAYVARVCATLAEKRDLLCAGVAGVEGLSLPLLPRGAFYALVDVRGWLGARRTDVEDAADAGDLLADDVAVAHFLLDAVRLSVVPGQAFHAPGHVRLSFAASRADIEEAVARLHRARAVLA